MGTYRVGQWRTVSGRSDRCSMLSHSAWLDCSNWDLEFSTLAWKRMLSDSKPAHSDLAGWISCRLTAPIDPGYWICNWRSNFHFWSSDWCRERWWLYSFDQMAACDSTANSTSYHIFLDFWQKKIDFGGELGTSCESALGSVSSSGFPCTCGVRISPPRSPVCSDVRNRYLMGLSLLNNK